MSNVRERRHCETVEDARSYVEQQPVKHADERGWPEGVSRSRAWLWTVVTTHVVVFMIHARRNAEAAKELLGTWRGVLATDRQGAYHGWPNCRRQFCRAHLERDIQAIVELAPLPFDVTPPPRCSPSNHP